jgi:hypothetical protein
MYKNYSLIDAFSTDDYRIQCEQERVHSQQLIIEIERMRHQYESNSDNNSNKERQWQTREKVSYLL